MILAASPVTAINLQNLTHTITKHLGWIRWPGPDGRDG
jgi:hypothetical protein